MPRQRVAAAETMVNRMASALAKADGPASVEDPARYRRLALAALKPLAAPSEAMIDAAQQSPGLSACCPRDDRIRDPRRGGSGCWPVGGVQHVIVGFMRHWSSKQTHNRHESRRG